LTEESERRGAAASYRTLLRQLGRLDTLARSVGQQATELSDKTERIDGRETVASSQQGDLLARSIVNASGIKIRPVFGAWASPATTDSSSDMS
jgi:hypothetical protein